MANITLNDKEQAGVTDELAELYRVCLLYTSPSPRD